MRLGIFMMPVHPPTRSFTDTLAEDEEKALYADKLGFMKCGSASISRLQASRSPRR